MKFLIKNIKIIGLFVSVVSVGLAVTLLIINNLDNINEPRECIVQFQSNGGTNIEQQVILCGEKIGEPLSPKKDGFNFKYWEMNSQEYNFDELVHEDIILDAVYEVIEGVKTVTVSFDTSGGNHINNIQIVSGSSIEKPIDPVRNGFVFKGWYLNYEKYDFSSKIDNDITLLAKWEEKSDNSSNIKVPTSSSKYACQATFRGDVPLKNVSVGYNTHVNWTWSTYGVYDNDECYITYKTSDENIATVDASGHITAKNSGTVYIYECANDNATKKEVICFKGKLNVQDPNDSTTVLSEYDSIVNKYVGIWYLEGYSDVYITVSKYKMFYEAMNLMPTNVDIQKGEIYPNGYGNIQISYSNWNSDISKNGVTLGDDYISIKTLKGIYKFTKVKGTTNMYSGSKFYEALGKWYLFNKPESYLEIYKTGDENDPRQFVSYCITPYYFDIATLDYENGYGGSLGCGPAINNEVLEQNNITISNGEMTITNSNKTVKLYKTKKTISVVSVELNKESLTMDPGDTYNLNFSISPIDAYNKNVTWSSSDESIAKVDNSGKVTAISRGNAIITVTTSDGSKTASCVVEVIVIDVSGVSLNKENLSIVKGKTETLTAVVEPSNAYNKNVTWSSSDESIVKVDSLGKITAISKGSATITVKTVDGEYIDTCEITVINPPLTAIGNFGYEISTSIAGVYKRVWVGITASGGTGEYTYYIKVYKSDGTLVAQTTDINSSGVNLSNYTKGEYYAEFEVTDSDGAVYNGKTDITYIGI